MTNKEFAKQLEKRTRQFAVRIIKLSARLPNSPEGRVIKNQLTEAGTSVGANYREANRPELAKDQSKADFKNKMQICEGECSETQFWLEVVIDAEMLPFKEVKPDYDECSQLLAIFTSALDSLDG